MTTHHLELKAVLSFGSKLMPVFMIYPPKYIPYEVGRDLKLWLLKCLINHQVRRIAVTDNINFPTLFVMLECAK